MSYHLPHDLIFDILSVLPAKTIIRFEMVSKSWCSLFEEPSFLDSRRKQTKKSLIIDSGDWRSAKPTSFVLSDLDSLDRVKEITFPFDLGRSYTRVTVMGSCNGLVALCCTYGGMRTGMKMREDVIIWNISTTERQIIPDPFWDGDDTCLPGSTNVGFGYDSVSDSYKILKICVSGSTLLPVLYNLKRNQVNWRLEKFRGPENFHVFRRGLLLEECLHWLSILNKTKQYTIVGFGLEKEEFYDVPLPDCAESKIAIGVLGTSLSMTNTSYIGKPWGEIWVWVMNEYMVKDSWTKIYKVDVLGNVLGSPVGGDQILLIQCLEGNLYLYDPIKKESSKVVEIPGGFLNVLVYQEGFTKISPILGALPIRR